MPLEITTFLKNYRLGREQDVGTMVRATHPFPKPVFPAPPPLYRDGWQPDQAAFLILAETLADIARNEPGFELIRRAGCDCCGYKVCRYCGTHDPDDADGVEVPYGPGPFETWLHAPTCPIAIAAMVQDWFRRNP